MSKAELKAQYLFKTLHLDNLDDEVRRHLMVLLLNVPSKSNDSVNAANKKKIAIERLDSCVTLPDDFDYKTSISEVLKAKYL